MGDQNNEGSGQGGGEIKATRIQGCKEKWRGRGEEWASSQHRSQFISCETETTSHYNFYKLANLDIILKPPFFVTVLLIV